MRKQRAWALIVLAAAVGACEAHDGWELPIVTKAPPVAAPQNNPTTQAKVVLGQHLFYDRRLSINESRSCGICHEQQKAFTDGFPRALGATRDMHPRNSQTLTNVVYRSNLTWSDPTATTLEAQLLTPLFGLHPVEMGMAGLEDVLLQRLAAEPVYPALFEAAFPGEGIRTENIAKAIAAFERTIVSSNNGFDRYQRGEQSALNEQAQRGMRLFFSDKAGCSKCHSGSDLDRTAAAPTEPPGYFNVGLYNLDGMGAYPQSAQGLIEKTSRPEDMGRFRTPTLRNVGVTGPYFHDGSVLELRQAIQIHLDGGRNVQIGPRQGDGRTSPVRDRQLFPRTLSSADLLALEAFLMSLTDEVLMSEPGLADPWMAAPDLH